MRHVSIDCVEPGMVIARHVYPPGESTGLPLLASEVVVTEAILERLIRSNVTAVLIEDELSEGIEVRPPITDAVRASAIGTLRSAFAGLRGPNALLSISQLADIEGTMSSIMAEISSRRNLLVCLSDLKQFGGERMNHAVNVCVIGCTVARNYFEEHGWRDFKGNRRQDQIPDRLLKLGIGLLLQDIGSLAIPDSIWEKRGILTAEERAIMQMHPALGVEMLEGSEVSPLTKVTIAQHHERYNGSGFPKGLSGDDIHDNGQVAALADAYVALCDQEHDGQKAFAPHDAYRMIVQARGKLFNPDLVDAFIATVAPYGPGTSIRMSDGKYGIVVSNNAEAPLFPTVRVTHDGDGLQIMPPFELDLSKEKSVEITEATESLPSDHIRV